MSLATTSLLGAGAATARAEDGPLRIGVLLDTSGPASIHGTRQLLGVRHQAELINLGAGQDRTGEVRLLVRDTQGRVDVTRQHAETLLTKDDVDALIGTSMPATAEAVIPIAQAAGVPMILPTTVSPQTQPNVFSSAPTSEQTARQLMRTLAAAAARRAAMLILDSLGSPQRIATYYREAAAHGVELIAVEQFSASATTLDAPLRTLTATTPDAVVVASPPPFNSMAARDLRAQPWPGPLFCSAGAGHPAFLQQAGPAAEGVRVVAPWFLLGELAPDTLPNSWAIREFVASFVPRHGPVGSFAGYGADAVTLTHHAYSGHRDRRRARTTLEHLTYVGLTGVFHRTPTDHAGLPDDALTTVVVRNGRWAPNEEHP